MAKKKKAKAQVRKLKKRIRALERDVRTLGEAIVALSEAQHNTGPAAPAESSLDPFDADDLHDTIPDDDLLVDSGEAPDPTELPDEVGATEQE